MAAPAPTLLTATVRYLVAGTRVISWVPTIASKSAPTLSELNAGTNLTYEYQSVTGFDLTSAKLDVPDAGSRFTASIPGRQSSSDSSINFYASSSGSDVRTLLTLDLNGFIVIYNEGLAGSKMDVFPVRVAGVPKSQDIEAAGMIDVQFAITSKPVLDVTIPTS